MICVQLEGGLGNQLFQYAAARALALRHGTEVQWDLDLLRRPPAGVTPRAFELDRFQVRGQAIAPARVRGMRWLRRTPRLARVLNHWQVHREAPGGFDPAFAALPDHSYLSGYWQSWRYFQGAVATIARELTPSHPLSGRNSAVLAGLASEETIAVHVRRGDYVTLAAASAWHGVLPLTWYAQALARVRAARPWAQLLVFSDDPEWCRANLPQLERDTRFVSGNSGPDAWQDLVLMAGCHHHIIANSSFSWWGAWLADQRHGADRQVIAPARWLASAPVSAADRFPAHWQVLD